MRPLSRLEGNSESPSFGQTSESAADAISGLRLWRGAGLLERMMWSWSNLRRCAPPMHARSSQVVARPGQKNGEYRHLNAEPEGCLILEV